MNSKNELSVFHVRSSQAVISAGYRLFMGNFRKLLRRTWLFGIIYALVVGVLMRVWLQLMPQLLVMASNPSAYDMTGTTMAAMGASSFLILVLMLGCWAAWLLFYAPAVSMLGEHQATGVVAMPAKWFSKPDWHMMLRLLKLCLWLWAIGLIASFVIGLLLGLGQTMAHPSMRLLGATGVLLCLIAAALLMPLVYTAYKYLLTPGSSFLKVLSTSYPTALRHWGSIFLVGLMVYIVTFLLSAIVLLPYYILTAALTTAQLGVLGGDPMGMPDYMSWMSLVVFTISGFILGYLSLSTLFPFYYLYGSITKQEDELTEMRNQKLTSNNEKTKDSVH
jgi:hypothetical protein